MEQQRRLAVLSRHLASSAANSSAGELPPFDAREVFLFLTRDNVELRAKILDFLQVRGCLHASSLQALTRRLLLSMRM